MFIPEDVLEDIFQRAGKSKGAIPVKGKLNGKPFTQTLVKYSGAWRLYLNTPMRKAAGIDVGDTANVDLDFDSKSRIISEHPKLKAAFKKNKTAKKAFDLLPPSRQKEIMRYINHLKTDASVKKNISRVLQHLTNKKSFA